MNQNHSSQSFVTQQLPQRSNENIRLEMAKLIKNNQMFFINNVFPHEEASMEVLLAKERIFKLIQAWDEKQIDSWNLPALLLQLLNNSQTIDEMFKQQYSIQYKEYVEKFPDAVTTILPTEEPEYSLSMGYEHLSTTLETESDEVKESSAKNLLPIPREYEVTSDDESAYDVPIKDDSSPAFTTFSNPLFDYNDDFTSRDDESLPDEDVPTEEFKVYSNPLFDDGEINSDEIDPHCFNDEYDLIEYLLNRDTLIDSSPKFDFLLNEFSGELAHINPILPEIKEADFDLEEEIHFVENLLYDNSSPRPPKELNAEIADTIIESLSPSPIPELAHINPILPEIKEADFDLEEEIHFVENLLYDNSSPRPPKELNAEIADTIINDSLMDEIALFLAIDELLPSNIMSDDYDSEGDIRFLEELLIDDSIPLPNNESSDFEDDSLFP
nr:hypothetical protein [Tanacetum cinerariifolium]